MLKIVEKSWNEFWAAYWRIDNRHNIPGIFEWDRKLVDFIEHVCRLKPGMRILDLGCGGGDQAKLFSGKGYDVVGIDIAPPLIEFARRQYKEGGLSGSFIAGDMRRIDYDCEFDACVILSGTFGFFGDTEDLELLRSIRRALKSGGKLFVQFLSVERWGKRERSWSEIEDGWELSESWYDAETGTQRGTVFIIRKDGSLLRPKIEPGYNANEVIRCYTLPEMQAMLAQAGLRATGAFSSGDFSLPPAALPPETVRNIVVAERPPEE